jgi:hypothetical protein
MTLALTIFGGVAAAAIAAVLAHRLTSQRDQINRRSDLRIEYLLGAYRALADIAHRDLEPATDRALAFGKTRGLDDLLLSLRDDLRKELDLEPIASTPSHVRLVKPD